MKTNPQQMWNAECGMRNKNAAASAINSVRTPHSALRVWTAFTLIELLVVISIIAVLAAFTIPVMHTLKRQQYIRSAQAEMQQLETALENYKAKYGAYPPSNQINNSNYAPLDSAQFSQLYYELSGVTHNSTNQTYTTLDGASTISETQYKSAFGVGGVINTSMGGGEDAASAKNFLSGLSSKQFNYQVTNNGIKTTMLITSVGGPDPNYQPLNAQDLNPFRYVYPGVNNPNSYDLWVELSFGSSFSAVNVYTLNGTTNKYLICNWSKSVQRNSPLPHDFP